MKGFSVLGCCMLMTVFFCVISRMSGEVVEDAGGDEGVSNIGTEKKNEKEGEIEKLTVALTFTPLFGLTVTRLLSFTFTPLPVFTFSIAVWDAFVITF